METEYASKDMYVAHKLIFRSFRETMRRQMKEKANPDVQKILKKVTKGRLPPISNGSKMGKAYALAYDAVEQLNKRNDVEGGELIAKALKLDPDNDEALLIKMDVLQSYGMLDEAEKCADKLISLEGLNPRFYTSAYFTKSSVALYRAFKRKDRAIALEALEYIDSALSSDPDDYDSIMQKAAILYQLGDSRHTKWLDKARKLNGKRTEKFMEECWISERLL